MRETPLSNVEKNFVLDCIKKNLRLDGRKFNDYRSLKINFGADLGSAHVTLGETRVLAQVSCELGEPKASRPNEGLLYINVELGPMAAIHFEAGRNSDLTVQINRILERTFKDSKCVDLESLCVTAEDKAWILRVDLNVLNHEGNIVDCAAIAALCALAHFKRPDVTVSDEEIKIHSASEKDPIPIVLHHYPVCISFATFHNGEKTVVDPTILEERTAETNMIFGFNSYRELCCLNLGGTTLISSDLLLQCAHKAANRAKVVVEQVKEALAQDAETRLAGKSVGFAECLRLGRITSLGESRLAIKLPNFDLNSARTKHEKTINQEDTINQETVVKKIDENTSILESTQANIKWVPESGSSETSDTMDEDDDDATLEQEVQEFNTNDIKDKRRRPFPATAKWNPEENSEETSSDSEEEEVMVLE